MDTEKADLESIHCLARNYLWKKRREFNLESHLAFLEYVKTFDRFKREKLFEKLQTKIFPIYY